MPSEKSSAFDIFIVFTLRYGGSSRTASSYYGGSFGGSQDLIDMYGHETDSVFTDEDTGDHMSYRSGNYRYEEPFPLRKRVLSDPAIHQNTTATSDSTSDLYVNLHENLSLHSRYFWSSFEYNLHSKGYRFLTASNTLFSVLKIVNFHTKFLSLAFIF